jgi:hypothetical protein
LSQFTNSEFLGGKGSWVPLKKNSDALTKTYTVNLSPSLPPEEAMTYYQGNCTLRKRKQSDFFGVNGHHPELLLIPGGPKYPSSSPARAEAYEGQVINGVLALIHLTGAQCDYSVVISPGPEFIVGIDGLGNWLNKIVEWCSEDLVTALPKCRTSGLEQGSLCAKSASSAWC